MEEQTGGTLKINSCTFPLFLSVHKRHSGVAIHLWCHQGFVIFIHILTVASRQEGSGFEPTSRLGLFCMEFACSPCACVGFLQILLLPLPKTCRLIGDSKLPIGVNVSVSGCLSLYVTPLCPVTDWRPVQGVPCHSPNASWDQLQKPRDPVKDKRYR